MSEPYLIERRQEARLRWFGTGLGLALAGLVHLAIFWGPEVRYRPLLEEAQVRRVLVVQPYRPAPPPPLPPPQPKTPGSGAPSAPNPKPAASKPATAAAAPPEASVTPPLIPDRKSAVTKPSETALAPQKRGDISVAKSEIPHLDTDAARLTPPEDEWTKVLSELQAQSDTFSSMSAREVASARSAEGDARGGRGRGGRGGGGESGFLDPRIRLTVVSYPPTPIVEEHPLIPYPDLRFRRRELEAGICRVYYRVWTDPAGKIERKKLEAPQTREDQERYAPFVDAVTASVNSWPLAKTQAEIHVDVLFEIE